MHFKFRNVNDAFRKLVSDIYDGSIPTVKISSRVGPVLRVTEPVLITYERPTERVLFNAARDANPFFHLYEALWMLAGRNDLASIQRYVSTFSQFSDDGHTLNGAYGFRWRNARSYDQIRILVDHLRETPNSRRAVLQMWNVEDDLRKVNKSKDVCCNLSVMFSIRESGVCNKDHSAADCSCPPHDNRWLDMTVTNRSNDLVWGMLGANYVHFTVLQEYMAAQLGVGVGLYHHFTNDLHVYTERFEPRAWLADDTSNVYTRELRPVQLPLISSSARFEDQLHSVVDCYGSKSFMAIVISEPFLLDAVRMFEAFVLHKHRKYEEAIDRVHSVVSDDWRTAGEQWIKSRQGAYTNANRV